MSRRVVVTGMGAVTPLGVGREATWEGLAAGRSGIRRISKFAVDGMPAQIAAESAEVSVADIPGAPPDAECAFNTRMGITAAWEALQQAGFANNGLDRTRLGVSVAAGSGAYDNAEIIPPIIAGMKEDASEFDFVAAAKAMEASIKPHFALRTVPGLTVGQIAQTFGAQGPQLGSLTACAAGTQAIGDATRSIQYGDADVYIAGGADTRLYPLGLVGYTLLGALCTDSNDNPEKASRPFDATRKGFTIGEGAGIVILEGLDHAQARGAKIFGEVIGFGASADAFRVTDPHPEGRGAILAINAALRDAGIDAGEVDYINAHGTSTQANDLAENFAIHATFAERANQVPVSSFKSMIGHSTAASGAVEFVGTLTALSQGILPPTINTTTLDPRIDLNIIMGQALRGDFRTALSNSFGFGGQNACLLMRRWDD